MIIITSNESFIVYKDQDNKNDSCSTFSIGNSSLATTKKARKNFLATGASYAGAEMLGRYHSPGSLEGWILVKAQDPKALYEHAAEWAEFLDWETTPVFTDEEAGPICAKIYG